MKLVFSEHAREDYLYWQKTDKKILKRINELIQATSDQRILCPPLKHNEYFPQFAKEFIRKGNPKGCPCAAIR